MIRIEIKNQKFLEEKPQSLQCKIPPMENYIELANMQYQEPVITYKTTYYDLECQLVATGEMMCQDFIHSTVVKTFHIVKTSKGFYYMLNMEEIDKYLVAIQEHKCACAC